MMVVGPDPNIDIRDFYIVGQHRRFGENELITSNKLFWKRLVMNFV